MTMEKRDERHLVDLTSHKHWIDEIREYINEMDDRNVIIFCMSYTLQTLRNNQKEIYKHRWEYDE